MMVLWVGCMKKAYKHFGTWNKYTGYKWVLKIIVWHWSIIEIEGFINFQLVFFNFLTGPILLTKRPQTEKSIFLVCHCIVVTTIVLFYLIHFDAIIWVILSILLFKLEIKIINTVSLYIADILWLFNNRIDPLIVKANNHWHYWIRCLYRFLIHQVIENSWVLFELVIWFQSFSYILLIFIWEVWLVLVELLRSPAHVFAVGKKLVTAERGSAIWGLLLAGWWH
jgi:hypothetical protein